MESQLKRMLISQHKTRYLVDLGLRIITLVEIISLVACSSVTNATEEVLPQQILSPSATPYQPPAGYVEYTAQSGDTLPVVSAHFAVEPSSVISNEEIPQQGLIGPGQILYAPAYQGETTSGDILIYDSDLVYSPSAKDFNLAAFMEEQGGFLSTYSEERLYGDSPAADILGELAFDNSINPRILLTFLEMNGNWVTGTPPTREQKTYPFNYIDTTQAGLFSQAVWTIQQLKISYYGWRAGTLSEVVFPDKSTLRLAPNLNAGTVAVMYYLSQVYPREEWQEKMQELTAVHDRLFGDAYPRAMSVEPLFQADMDVPELRLPFSENESWNYTCGPHSSWARRNQPYGALDFAPPLGRSGCGTASHYATAMTPGLVVYSFNGRVLVDMDEDGSINTGWVFLYMHMATEDRVKVGTYLDTGDRIGHPSCEGGYATGTHVHVARMYNGEWILAVGGLPFILSGYLPAIGEKLCEGTLTRLSDNLVVNANRWGISYKSKICQPESEICAMYTPTPKMTPTRVPSRTPTPTLAPIKTPIPTQIKEP